jgi:hypothetical protein
MGETTCFPGRDKLNSRARQLVFPTKTICFPGIHDISAEPIARLRGFSAAPLESQHRLRAFRAMCPEELPPQTGMALVAAGAILTPISSAGIPAYARNPHCFSAGSLFSR